jgi:S1-C subfamily serine protease
MFRSRSLLMIGTLCFCAVIGRLRAEVYQLRFSSGPVSWVTAIPVDDGKTFIALVPPEVEPDMGVALVHDGSSQKARISMDPVTRLIVAKAEALSAEPVSLREDSNVPDGFRVEARGGLLRGSIVGRIQRISGKILPLALLKVLYTETAPPISGEAVMDPSGQLLGLSYEPKGSSDVFILPVEVIHRSLQEMKLHAKILRPWIGLMLSPDRMEPRVTQVLPDSPASRAGLREGDLLMKVGTRPVSSYEEAVNAFYYLQPEKAEPVEIMRESGLRTLSIVPMDRSYRKGE